MKIYLEKFTFQLPIFNYSMVEVTQKAWNVGDNISLRLMRRERGSLLAVPVSQSLQATTPTTFFTLLDDNSDVIYSKLLLADSTNVRLSNF